MPKYKEININVKMAPEAILGNLLRDMMAINASQQAKTNTDTAQTNK